VTNKPLGIPKPNLLTVEDAKHLDVVKTAQLFCDHLNPGQFHFLKLLGFHRILIDSAEGMYYVDQNGRRILDFFGGFEHSCGGRDDTIPTNKTNPRRVKPKIFGPLTLLGFSVVDSLFFQSIAVRIAPGSCQPMSHVA